MAFANLGQVAYRQGKANDGASRRNFESALRLLEAHHPRNKWRLDALLGLARIANLEGNHEQSFEYCKQALALIDTNAVDSDGMARGAVYQNTGNISHWLSRYADAETNMRKAVREYEQSGGPEHPFAIDGKRELGVFLTWTGKRAEAKQLLGEALASQERAKGADDPELTAYSRMDFGHILLLRGELAVAEPHLVRVLNSWRAAGAPTARPLLYLARIHMEQGRLDQAERELDGIEPIITKTWGEGSWSHATALTRLGDFQLALGRTADARRIFERVRDEWQEEHLTTNRAYALTALLRMQLAAGDAAAVSSARDLIAKIEASRSRADMPDEEAAAHMLLGVALMRAGDPAAARGHLERAVAMREQMDAAESLWLAQARLYLAQCLYRSADRAAARRMLDLAAAAHRQHAVLGPQHRDLLTQTRTLIAS